LARRLALAAALAPIVALAPAAPALAHHSFAMFDQTKIETLDGTVHEFQWTNPHAFIELDVTSAGKTTRWSLELNSPNNLTRQGWHRTSLKPGDKVTVSFNPLRSGKHGGLFLDVKLPDGKVLDSGLPKNGKPINVPQV
jgi:hypothetical protein